MDSTPGKAVLPIAFCTALTAASCMHHESNCVDLHTLEKSSAALTVCPSAYGGILTVLVDTITDVDGKKFVEPFGCSKLCALGVLGSHLQHGPKPVKCTSAKHAACKSNLTEKRML